MNCRKDDIAFVVYDQTCTNPLTGEPIIVVKAGTVVKVVRLIDEISWEIEEPVPFQVEMLFLVATYTCWAIDDSQLRPIRGDGVTDDQVAELYAPSRAEVTA